MGATETIATIRTQLTELVDRANDRETALLAHQIHRCLQELELEHCKAAADLESQFREERVKLVTELKALLPQAARERDEARAKAKELEARNLALETRIKAMEPKAGAPKVEPKPVNVRAPVSSRDFDVR